MDARDKCGHDMERCVCPYYYSVLMNPAAAKTKRREAPGAASGRPTLLLAWYDRHRRRLPWRPPAGERADPYRVWLSEIMLQQTGVKTVGPYFEKFLARWPDVASLGGSSLDEVLRMWAGLGYYSRARNLHACAVAVLRDHGGAFPDSEEGLRSLPGIGPYTAAAIAAIAFAADPAASRHVAGSLSRGGQCPSADGPRLVDLRAEEAGLRAVPAQRGLCGTGARRSGKLSTQGAEEDRRTSAGRGFRGHTRR